MNSIIVIGSSNTDMVIRSPRIPVPGETIIGGSFFTNPGGKGANQAVAAARLGGKVVFVTRTGNDSFGKESFDGFRREGIDLTYASIDPLHPSGVALITVDDKGENTIVVASGANSMLTPDVFEAKLPPMDSHDTMLLQLEIPMDTVIRGAAYARQQNARVILNPAPACELTDDLLKNVSIITPNETEASFLSRVPVKGKDSAARAASLLQRRGPKTVIITLGSQGAIVLDGHELYPVPAPSVTAVDTTAAGDVFNGALAVGLAEGIPLDQAVEFACKAAAISVTRQGAQSSAPYRKEVQ